MKIFYNHIAKGVVLCMLLCGFLFTACTHEVKHDEPKQKSTLKEGERFTTQVALNAEDLFQEQLRSTSIEHISEVKSLRVLVFDENQNFLYSEDAKTLGSNEKIDTGRDQDFLPDNKQDGITETRVFEVSLIKSAKKRYVHFVANHDWTGFAQDYYAKGTSAGEFMTHASLVDKFAELQGTNPQDLSLWSMYETNTLDENTFKNKVVKLLRTYAKITLKVDVAKVNPVHGAERFELTGFALCNVPDRGTIAPFTSSKYDYQFPFSPMSATRPIGLELLSKEEDMASVSSKLTFVEVTDATKETAPYYMFEKDNTKPDHKTFVIIRGKRYNSNAKPLIKGEDRYYKLDLVTRKQIDPEDPNNKGFNTYFPILRNKYYTVNINGVKSDGYKTVKDAIESVAGNNVFADTKLQEYGNISDGVLTLSVDPIQRVIVKPGKYTFSVNYSGGNEHVKYYPSWDTNQDKTQPGYTEPGYYYTKGNDSFLGGLGITKGADGKLTGFEIEVVAIPADATKEYTVDIAALRQHNGKAVDGTSGATSPLTRTIRIVLTAPFPFNGELTGASSQRILSFRVYEEQVFPKSMFPFDVYIEAPGMTPVNDGGKHNMTIENIYNAERGKYVTYYKYTVQETDRGTVKINFKVNNPSAGPGKVNLTSDFYKPQLIDEKKR